MTELLSSALTLYREATPLSDPVRIFAVTMAIILLSPIVFRLLRLPGILGLIVSGAIVGPSAMGLMERDATIILLGTVGLLYLMFNAGLSMDLVQFERLRGRSMSFGLLSFVIPQLLALAVGVWWLDYSIPTALLLGSVVGSHTLLAYPIAQRLGIATTPPVTMTTGGTLVTDTLSLLILAIVVASLQEDVGVPYWLGFAGMLTAFVFVVHFGIPRLGRWFFRTVRNQPTTEFGFLLVVLFATAVLADLVGLAPIIGAFAAGITLNRLVPDNGTLMSRVHFVGDALLVPFFLLSVGMLVDFSVLFGSVEVWITATVFTLLVTVGKGLAAKLAQFLFRLPSEAGWTMAGLTIPQAAATLAVTLIAFELRDAAGERIFSAEMVNGVVLMILFTCIIGPSLVERFGRVLALEAEKSPSMSDSSPQRIMVPLANPATADALVDIALMLRSAGNPEPIFPITVARDGADVEEQVARGEGLLAHAVKHAAAANIPVTPLTRVDMNVAAGVLRALKERRASHLVIGWNGIVTTKDRIFGSVLDQLLEEAWTTSFVCRLEQPLGTTERVFIAIPPDAWRESNFRGVIGCIKRVCSQLGANVVLICHASDEEPMTEAFESAKPELGFETIAIGEWEDLLTQLRATVESNDLVIVLTARQNTLAWRPSMRRLPQDLGRRLEENNFLIVYPPDASLRKRAGAMWPQGDDLILRGAAAQEVRHQIAAPDLESLMEQLLAAHFSGQSQHVAGLKEHLLRRDGHAPELIGEGALLFDAHTASIDEPLLLIGTVQSSEEASSDASAAEGDAGAEQGNDDIASVRSLVVLLSPLKRPRQEHLHHVARIAARLRSLGGDEPEPRDRAPAPTTSLL